ncbi:flagellar basal body P-ring formation chaperone FlgA [Pseudorhodobacter sp. W20_MBD10_FR17]|uniref:flagellar basal body P-ring formation chaperone FlgA n=1 Tax=Pseudorhodobacter sp. W20_MBD10_FR17 TaxID=3240266 RepID=UPI003F9D637D
MAADSLTATRVIRAKTLLSVADVTVIAATIPGALVAPADAIGLEARVTLYPGRPIRSADVGPPAVVERNQIVTLIYSLGGLGITTEGRALGRGSMGDVIGVMNLSSRKTVVGQLAKDGSVYVGPTP